MIIKDQNGNAMSNDDRLALATLLVKFGYTVRLCTIRENGTPRRVVEYTETEKFKKSEKDIDK